LFEKINNNSTKSVFTMRLKITLLLFVNMLLAIHVTAQCNADFQEANGIAILEMESESNSGFRNEVLPGASAGRALAYRGANRFNSPDGSTITYSVRINTPGTYRFIWRNRIGVVAATNANTEHNDSWLRITGGNVLFFGARNNQNGSRIFPGGSGRTPTPNGASSGGWFKVYTNIINWNWDTFTSDFDGHFIYANFPSAGTYNVQISGRSNGHFVDRMVLYNESQYSNSQARDLARAVTSCSGGGNPPPPPPPPPPPTNNIPPSVSFTNISNGQNFASGSNISIGLSSNDSDGSVTQHRVFVNGTLVDTDGAAYSPHIITNAAPGNYTIVATVTDNSGANTSVTANISVGSGTPPPPPPPPSGNNAAPSVSFTNLSNGQQVAEGSTVSVGLSASDSDGSVVRYQIFVNGTLVDTDGTTYTPHPIVNIQSGNYTIRATVTDNDGATTSSTVSISAGSATPPPPPPPSGGNAAPVVSFTNLTNGQQVATGSTVSVGVSASDSDGSVVRYQIFVNGTLVDTDGASYTPHPIVNIQSGNYAIRATVTDNDGATASATVNITAGSGTPPPPPPTSNEITFSLINASTNTVRQSISNGTNIASAQGVNIRANAPSNTGSVRLTLSGPQSFSFLENNAPYALYGDINGNYIAANLISGSYTIRAIAYSGNGASGSVIADTTISFSVGSSTSARAAFAYPNPVKADGRVSLKLPDGGLGNYQYFISNSLGVTLESGRFSASDAIQDVDLQLSNVGNQGEGVYYMTIISRGSRQVIPIIRE